jgi:histidine triad (HIT) family protein
MCIFCKIINNEIPSYKVYEDDNVLAFLDIAPVNPGHTLVLPKKHYANFEEITEEDLTKVILTVKKIGLVLKEKLGIKGYNIQINNDFIAGQLIPHFHVHIIPRQENDNLHLWPQGKYKEGEVEEILKKIKI